MPSKKDTKAQHSTGASEAEVDTTKITPSLDEIRAIEAGTDAKAKRIERTNVTTAERAVAEADEPSPGTTPLERDEVARDRSERTSEAMRREPLGARGDVFTSAASGTIAQVARATSPNVHAHATGQRIAQSHKALQAQLAPSIASSFNRSNRS